ncbi:MAG: T9SS type A sorting domain-containing protein [Bacteroidales bacterium]|nr:T9SS type A sorting domain-containing protein [Bacteroidales bacterium]
MKTIFKLTVWALLLGLVPFYATAQEVLTGFNHNVTPPVKTREATSITLPFYDDFSGSRVYPDSTKWSDFNVYVNAGFPLNTITRNGATFDVLDDQGRVYDYAISNPFVAEYLTSVAIRLDSVFEPEPKALTPADSLVFSFFYQPQGNGNAPEAHDSLVLEFGIINELDTLWHHAWSTPGMTLSQFLAENDSSYFKQVMIPITDTAYFKPGFCFRFYNYASIVSQAQPSSRGNEDNWNIDVVYLNYGRSVTDASYPKVSFTGETPSFLNRYRAMPYKHYRANPSAHISEFYPLHISNLDNQAHQLKHQYTVEQINGSQQYSYTSHGTINTPAMTYSQPETGMVAQLFALDYDRDTTSFLVRHYISDSTCNPPLVDSMVYLQGFYNYFAYDDGIPELGFGVEPSPGGSFAVKFELSELDTLSGVQILFNHTLNDANNQYFDIVVWKDNNGKPGDEAYRLSGKKPYWEDQIYKFVYYKFDRKIRLNGVFYIGIVQQGSGLLNVGFDTSSDYSQYNFINVTGSWQQSSKRGAIMLRPVVGSGYFIGVNETSDSNITVRPVPASTTLHIEGVTDGVSIALYDLTGRLVMQRSFTDEIPVDQLHDGLYLLNITTANGNVITKKIIVKP